MSIGATRALAGVGERVRLDGGAGVSARLRLRDGLAAETVRGDRDVARYAGCLDGFIAGCRDAGAWGGAMIWARDIVAQDGIPLAVLLYRGENLTAVALGSESMVRGCRTRLAVCGNLTGQRGFFTLPGVLQDERERLGLAAADAMMSCGLLALVLKLRDISGVTEEWRRQPQGPGAWSRTVGCTQRKVCDTFHTGTTFDESLSRFGAHTRRNLRYYRRRVERELGCEFLPALDGPKLREALVELQGCTDDPVRAGVAKNRIAQVARDPQAFCMGLRAVDGRWLSWISGWRCGRHTYIDWQCNRNGLQRYSLSTAMRSYLIEHESLMRQSHIHFLGGTSHSMHYGFCEESCTDWLLMRHAWAALLLRLASPALRWTGRLVGASGVAKSVAGGRRKAALRRSPAAELVRRIAGVAMRVSAG